MLFPRSRLLSVLETIEQLHVEKISRTDQRYPRRRAPERATQTFVTYLLLANLFPDGTQTAQETKLDRHPVSTSPSPEQ